MVEWVAQRYIQNPLLTLEGKRKFHIRLNVLAVGNLEVFVHYSSALVSTAALPFDSNPEHFNNKHIHISNAIYARQFHGPNFDERKFKFPLNGLERLLTTKGSSVQKLLNQMSDVVQQTFEVNHTCAFVYVCSVDLFDIQIFLNK